MSVFFTCEPTRCQMSAATDRQHFGQIHCFFKLRLRGSWLCSLPKLLLFLAFRSAVRMSLYIKSWPFCFAHIRSYCALVFFSVLCLRKYMNEWMNEWMNSHWHELFVTNSCYKFSYRTINANAYSHWRKSIRFGVVKHSLYYFVFRICYFYFLFPVVLLSTWGDSGAILFTIVNVAMMEVYGVTLWTKACLLTVVRGIIPVEKCDPRITLTPRSFRFLQFNSVFVHTKYTSKMAACYDNDVTACFTFLCCSRRVRQ